MGIVSASIAKSIIADYLVVVVASNGSTLTFTAATTREAGTALRQMLSECKVNSHTDTAVLIGRNTDGVEVSRTAVSVADAIEGR